MLRTILNAHGPNGRRGLPVLLVGPPGIGKTAAVRQAAAALELHLEVVLLSIREPADVSGLPIVGTDRVRLEPPAWAKRLAEKGAGVLFLDELSSSAPALQAAALRIMAEGIVGELELPPAVRIIAAANPEDLAAGGWALSAPLANRLVHIQWPAPEASAWAEWMISNAPPESGRAFGAVAAFIRRRPELLLKVPEDEAGRAGAWASPRSWELAALALAASTGPDRLTLLAGCVGEGAAKEAWVFLNALDLPDPEEVLAGREEIPLNRSDRTYAALAAVCAAALEKRPLEAVRLERMVTAVEIGRRVADGKHADVAMAALRPVCAAIQTAFANKELARRLEVALSGPLADVAQEVARGRRRSP